MTVRIRIRGRKYEDDEDLIEEEEQRKGKIDDDKDEHLMRN